MTFAGTLAIGQLGSVQRRACQLYVIDWYGGAFPAWFHEPPPSRRSERATLLVESEDAWLAYG